MTTNETKFWLGRLPGDVRYMIILISNKDGIADRNIDNSLFLHVFGDVSKSYFVHDNSVLTFIVRKYRHITFCLTSVTAKLYKGPRSLYNTNMPYI